MNTTITISQENKARFDNIQRVLSFKQKKSFNQDETLNYLLSEVEAELFKDCDEA